MIKSKIDNKKMVVLMTIIAFLSLLGIWELVARFTSASMFLPPASKIISEFLTSFVQPIGKYTMTAHIGISLYRVMSAFILSTFAGIALGVGMGYSKTVEAIFKPIFELIRPIPPLA